MVMAPMVWRADFRHPNRGHAIHFQPADDPPVDPLFTRNNRAQKGAPPWTERRVVFFFSQIQFMDVFCALRQIMILMLLVEFTLSPVAAHL